MGVPVDPTDELLALLREIRNQQSEMLAFLQDWRRESDERFRKWKDEQEAANSTWKAKQDESFALWNAANRLHVKSLTGTRAVGLAVCVISLLIMLVLLVIFRYDK